MQAVIAGTFGIPELHNRNASPVHICCASALKAKLWVDDSADKATAKANTARALRSVLVKDAVMCGSHWVPLRRAPCCDISNMRLSLGSDCDDSHAPNPR